MSAKQPKRLKTDIAAPQNTNHRNHAPKAFIRSAMCLKKQMPFPVERGKPQSSATKGQ
jgi:hypothetical protein